MTYQVVQIDATKLAALQSRQEGHFFDFKSKRVAPAKLSQTFSAFANADGGEVYVGIEDPAKGWLWDGFASPEEANPIIQVLHQIFPLGDECTCEFITCPGYSGLVLKIEIQKTADIKTATNDTPYIRRGAQNLPITTAEQITRLELNKGLRSFEDNTLQADKNEITNSTPIIEFMIDVVPDAEPEAWLRKQRLIIADHPTVAGMVLFSDEPQVYLPKSAIKIYRYKTSEAEGTRETLEADPITIEGNLYRQIYHAVAKVIEITESIPVLGPEGLEKIQYPPVAIHEIITNAVIHRDYSLNDDVHVRIFDNRIEVESPGVLPAHITVVNILTERFARNPKLVRLLNKHRNPPNKDVGEGLNTTFQAMRALKLREPQILQKTNSVVVILRHEKLGSAEDVIVKYLRDHEEINNSVARELCAIGDANKMKRVFQRMMKAEIITRIEGRPQNKAAYKKGPKFPYT